MSIEEFFNTVSKIPRSKWPEVEIMYPDGVAYITPSVEESGVKSLHELPAMKGLCDELGDTYFLDENSEIKVFALLPHDYRRSLKEAELALKN